MDVDIILISYNQETYIKNALESLFMQRVKEDVNVRIIVADDDSKDKTLDIISSLEDQSPFPYTYLPEERNLGLRQNYKRAFSACNGDYTLILEGDDYWCSPYHIEQHIRFLDVHRECSMSVNGIVLYWEESGIYEKNPRDSDDGVIYVNLKQQIMENRIGNLSACAFRTSLLHRLPYRMFEIDFADWLIGIIQSQYGFIALLNDYTSVYRKHPKGLWSGSEEAEHGIHYEDSYHKMDYVLNYRYTDLFTEAIAYHTPQDNSQSLSVADIAPPIIVKIIKFIVPRALLRRR